MAELFEDGDGQANGAGANGTNGNGSVKVGTKAAGKGRGAKSAAAVAEAEPLTDPFAEEDMPLSPVSSSEPAGGVPLMAAPTSPANLQSPELPERITDARETEAVPDMFAGEGLKFTRRFTTAGEDVYATTEWELRDAAITDGQGKAVFEQKGCEIPKAWSMLATNVVVSKYFRGKVGTPQRETSVRQLIGRVADTIAGWGRKGGYFASEADGDVFHDELRYLLLHQYMAFNSPVWFNLGVPGERPQVSACFINSVDDTMESILTLAKTEGMLFKWGSGTGTNLSVLRSSKEGLKGGGTASGPVSFMRGFDAFAGAIKCLTPDAMVHTENGLETLGEIISPDLAPGFHPDTSRVVATKDGPTRISHVYVSPRAKTYRLRLRHTNLTMRGTQEHPVLTLTPDLRLEWKRLIDLAAGDKVAVSRGTEMWPALAPSFADFAPTTRYAKKTLSYPAQMTQELARLLGYLVSEGCVDSERFRFSNADVDVFADFLHCVQVVFGVDTTRNVSMRTHPKTGVTTHLFEACWTNAVRFLRHVGLAGALSKDKCVPVSIRRAPRALVAAFLRAYFEGDGHVGRDIYAASASEQLLQEVQLLLLNMGMVSLLRPHPVKGTMYHSLYLRGEQAWNFVREVGFVSARKRAASELLGDKNTNTNIDTLPFLVDLLRTRCNKNGYFRCADGQTRFLSFGFFNRLPSSNITYKRLRSAPQVLDKVRLIEPAWADTLETLMDKEFFWDTAETVTAEEEAVTYDFTVPGTHSFIANGIVNHNSGGKTRRAAKMTILNADHPDIEEFIESKADAEKKAHSLIEAGYSGAFNVPNGAYDSVFFQNANHSVRATDEFMRAVELDQPWQTRNVLDGEVTQTYRARDLMHKIAEAAWVCGDPGMQFDTAANRWHTSPNSGRINASNPCCITGDTLIAVADGRNAIAIRDLVGQTVPVYAWDHQAKRTTIAPMYCIEPKRANAPVYRVTLDDGSSFRATDDHLIMLRDGSYRQVKDLRAGDSLNPFHSKVEQKATTRTRRRYVYTGASWRAQYRWIWEAVNGAQPEGYHLHHADFNSLNDALTNLQLMPATEHIALHREQMQGDRNPARRLMNDEWRANIARAVSGENNPNFGNTHGEATRAKMRQAAAARWEDPAQRVTASQNATARIERARQVGERVGRAPGERWERCCPACRENFITAREGQVFCSEACRYSPLALAMIGAKGGEAKQGRALTEAHRAKLSVSGKAAAIPADKKRAQEESLRARCLKAARLLMDAGHPVTLADWDGLRETARGLGAAHVPQTATLARLFVSDADLQEHTALYNHKVVSVELDGHEDVYDGTVDGHHNFAIVTSATAHAGGPDAPDFSGCFIHNSEFFYLDDTACNLASLNLMRFRDAAHEFDIELFKHAIRITATAMEIMVGNAAYPTDKITVNSFDYRPLGLGYANLGALLMARGIPYDSDEGRAYAAAITAILSGEGYYQSARIAERVGPFAGYAKNREPMLRVIQMHGDHIEAISKQYVPGDMITAARDCWTRAYAEGEKHGYRNSQISVLAPTGTIGFLMDCDTTGVEPDIAIVKYKSLVGGGMFKIVNQTVPEALERLGYTAGERKAVLEYIEVNDTIEGAPGLSTAHLPVFDCAFRARSGVRSIHYMGHIRMMSAVQPFISGAISKTVNMPHEATPDDIAEAYLQAWKLGVKALAIYRDGSKKTQPLSTGKTEEKVKEAAVVAPIVEEKTRIEYRPFRRKLPDERQSLTHKFSVGGHEGYLVVGMYPDGTPGEIFITMSKEGSVVSGLMDSFATSISLNLQYGVPLKVLVDKFMHTRFEPSGFTGNQNIPMAKSIMDYLFRYIALKFLSTGDRANVGLLADQQDEYDNGGARDVVGISDGTVSPALTDAVPGVRASAAGPFGEPAQSAGEPVSRTQAAERQVFVTQSDAPPCPECGSITTRNGACYRCANCGTSIGCS